MKRYLLVPSLVHKMFDTLDEISKFIHAERVWTYKVIEINGSQVTINVSNF